MEKQLGILGYGAVGKSLHSIYENLNIKISIASSIKYIPHLKENQYLEVINLEEYKKQNREKYGTAGLNIDACRIEYADENDRSGWHKTGGGGKGYMDTDTFKIRKISPEEIQERT